MPETAARLTGGVSMEKKSIETYDEAVEYLLNIPKFSKKNTLADTGVFLRCLGNPEKGRNIIHVAGTNGKGSVCTYMDAVLTEWDTGSAGLFPPTWWISGNGFS